LFIKFARNDIQFNIYGKDVWAQKAADHEIRSLNAFISCGIPNLHVPLMMTLSCYGHKIVVLSKLPINKGTLIYGSHDGKFIFIRYHSNAKLVQVPNILKIRILKWIK